MRVRRTLGGFTKARVGIVFVIIAVAILYAQAELLAVDALLYLGGSTLVCGLLLLYSDMEHSYCQNCGQRMGKLSNPRKCRRCGSNRIANRDPGVGEAVRVKRQR